MIEPRKAFRKQGLGYIYEPFDSEGNCLGISMRIDGIRGSGEKMTGELLVESTLPGVSPHLLMTVQNITGSQAKATLAKQLAAKTPGVGLDWDGLVEGFCVAVLRSERQGAPFQKVGSNPDEGPSPDVIEFLVQQGRTNDIHGPMGDGKGYLAALMAVCHTSGIDLAQLHCNAAGHVLYLDWEDDAATLNRRLKAAAAGLGVPPVDVDYRVSHGALRDQVLQIAREVATEHITLLIVDSVELACGIGSDHGTYEERAHGLHDALRAITTSVEWPVSTLLIDHISEATRANKKEVGKAYGSLMKMAWVRNAWEVRKEQEQGSPYATIGLFRFKGNHAGAVRPIGLRLDFTRWPAELRVQKADIRDSDELSSRQPATQQILDALRSGPMDTKDLATVTGLTREAVRVAVNRLKERRRVVQGTDGRWGLLATEQPDGRGVSSPDEPPEEQDEIPFH